MDPRLSEVPNFNSSFNVQTLLPDMLNEHPNPNSSALSSSFSAEGDDGEFGDSVLNFINQVLMEEDMESKPCMLLDPLALEATEESLYDVIGGGKYPASQDQVQNVEIPDGGYFSESFSDSSSSRSQSVESPPVNAHIQENRPSILQNPIPENFVFQSTSRARSQLSSNGNGMVGTITSELMVPDMLTASELLVHFNRGVEEASKFLPRGLLISAQSNKLYGVAKEKDGSEHFGTGLRGKKNHQREDVDLEDGRSTKQSAVYMDDEESELSDVFETVLLCGRGKPLPFECKDDQVCQDEANNGLQQDGQVVGIGNGKAHGNKKEVIDLTALLILCAEAVSVDDRGTAIELLEQIRQHSSPFGDSSQRLAHCFENALEARLAGTGSQMYAALTSKRISAADTLKFFQAYIAACPFMKMSMIFANEMILKVAEKAETLHIVDFGILYGFQWPALIHCLSRRADGPPKLRITGLERPLSGFRPQERVQETGHRLAKYCKRFNVPFEYYGIAKKWETVQFEDLKVQRNEVLAVNCLFRFKYLLDQTVVVNSPRDNVLNLIRKMNPDVFVQSDVNGSHHAPFFVSRFREALLYYSAFFDILDSNLPHEDEMRLGFEKEFIGREVLNIVACEGSERIVRPETYKQWQVRNSRAGFRQLPLDREVMKKIQDKVKQGYHPDFVVDEDGRWMLQGWKGRIMCASACWAPSRTLNA
ncbi:hypothetical protein M0R45_017205 [Rubus argutus]|uniref:Scarecrow-like protein 14 n=1 Tax=Rubus argutus TaxID=59490 RepID=A0AAW1XV01_RUBAR